MISIFKQYVKNIFLKKQFIIGDLNLNTRKGALHKSWGHVFSNHLNGDYVEFGVYKGESFIDSIKTFLEFKTWLKKEIKSNENWRAKVSSQSKLHNKIYFHALDTFEGMPKNNEDNFIFGEGNFKASEKILKDKINQIKNSEYEAFIYKGNFEHTALDLKKKLENRVISIVNFDCDLKESTSVALNTIKDKIQIGSILLFDDYNGFNANQELGQRKSFKDFKDETDFKFEKFFSYHYSGQSFLCIGKGN
tara:strand:- start:680 stop:1426 length:747 start_codon:yes stop_codon:yes gene_type:complete